MVRYRKKPQLYLAEKGREVPTEKEKRLSKISVSGMETETTKGAGEATNSKY